MLTGKQSNDQDPLDASNSKGRYVATGTYYNTKGTNLPTIHHPSSIAHTYSLHCPTITVTYVMGADAPSETGLLQVMTLGRSGCTPIHAL